MKDTSRSTAVLDALRRPERLQTLRATELLDSAPEEAFDRWTGWLSDMLDVPIAVVSLVDDRRQYFKSMAGSGVHATSTRGTPVEGSLCQYVVGTGAPFVVEDTRRREDLADHAAVHELRTVAYAGMPVQAEGQVLGALCVTSPEPRAWTEEELALLRNVSAAISAELSLRAIAQRLARAQRLVTAHSRIHELIAGTAPLPRVLDELTTYVESELNGVTARIATTGDGDGAWRAALRAADGTDLGTLVAEVTPPRVLADEEVALLEDAAQLATIAVERGRAHDLLTQRATCDAVTGLPNRNLLIDRLTQAFARARRTGTSTAVLFADLDGFKLVNDTRGHEIGDELLAAVAQRLTEAMRGSDTVARFGGDEFVILAEDVHGRQGAAQLADRLLRGLERPVMTPSGDVFEVRASVGVAVVPAGAGDPHDAIRAADAAMYTAKRAGGRRTHVAVDDTAAVPS